MSEQIKDKINLDKLPQHIAIIMDGNGRWANGQGMERVFGHKSGVSAVKQTVEACTELGIKFLTLYTFSTENWARPKDEVDALMELLINTISGERETLIKNKISLAAIGDLESLPKGCYNALMETIEATRAFGSMQLTLALSYSARWEIVEAVKRIALDHRNNLIKLEQITEETFSKYLTTHNIPDPELMIGTSGEYRISNYLLWQLAYTEFYFVEKLWPDFGKEDLYEAVLNYQNRQRRFGKTGFQIEK